MLTLLEKQDDHARKIREIFQVRCERDAWAADVRACIVSTTSLKDPKQCKSKLTPAQREVLDRDLAEADRVARAGKLPEHCEAYRAAIAKLIDCDKMPQQSRDALAQAFAAMEETWKNVGEMPEEAQRAMNEGCKAGVDALTQAAGAMCGWSTP